MRDLKENTNNLNIRDKLFINPIEKYQIFGKFPWRFILNIFLVILTTVQVLLVDSSTTSYSRAEEKLSL